MVFVGSAAWRSWGRECQGDISDLSPGAEGIKRSPCSHKVRNEQGFYIIFLFLIKPFWAPGSDFNCWGGTAQWVMVTQSLQHQSQPDAPNLLLFLLLLLLLSCICTATFIICTGLSGTWSSEEPGDLCLLPSRPHWVFHLQPIKAAACASLTTLGAVAAAHDWEGKEATCHVFSILAHK